MQPARVLAALAALALSASLAQAQTEWQLINEYPASALTGEGDAFFAEAVGRRTNGRVVIRLLPDAKSGLRTREQLKAVTDGRFAMANSFGGALSEDSPLFLLSSLPFVTPSTKDAHALYAAALPLYEKLFAERRQKLLYVSPWPASGVWSAAPLSDEAALKALKIRTYDKTGTEVFGQVAAAASVVSFADLNPKLEAGEINAVLSSGDGGAGRQLWRYLRYFADINYAVPLSFGSVSLDAWNALDDGTRAAILEAARETTERQWSAMTGRVAQNFARMRENKVVIDENPPAAVMTALRRAARKSIGEWKERAGPDAQQLLDAYVKSTAR
jgi:TRAP-type C4-dicarboxylate transport system substrate-binding protein